MAKGKSKPWDANWEKIRQLGGGGHGDAYLVRRRDDSSNVCVLKVLRNNDSAERRQRMHREVQALQQLQHRAIPKVVESNTDAYGDGETPLYFVVDYVEGPTLAEQVQQGRLLPVVAIRLGIRLSDILLHCHQNGIIHRDVKPDNIILRGGNPEDPVLIDFGQSFNKEDSERSTLTSEGQQLGNRFLHLPELQTGDSRKRHVESDISQTCGLIFYALTGKTPGPIVDHEDLKPHQRDSAREPAGSERSVGASQCHYSSPQLW